MRTVNVHEAKTHFSRLIDAVHAGETILVAKNGKPWARLVPLEPNQPRRQPGVLRGQLHLPSTEELLAPLPPEKLSPGARTAIDNPEATIFVSAASGWEIATKARLGKLPGAEGLLEDLSSLVQEQGFQPLAVQLHHGIRAGGYPQPHRDPHRCAEDDVFDRLLAAQAELEGLQLVSIDPAMATFPCRLLW